MKQFLEAIEQNPELKVRVEALKDKEGATKADVIALAKEYGFELTEEDFQSKNCELSDDELAVISAAGGCGCFAGGGGKGDGLSCGCYGWGEGSVEEVDGWSEGACICPVAGVGATNRDD